MKVKMRLDLTTREGRAAMRAWLDVVDDAADPTNRDAPDVVDKPGPPSREPTTIDTSFMVRVRDDGQFESVESEPIGPATLYTGPVPTASVVGGPHDFALGEATIDWPATAGESADHLEPLPEPCAPEPTPLAPVDVLDVAPPAQEHAVAAATGGGLDLDQERPWTEELRARAWALSEKGLSTSGVAERLSLRRQRVQSFLQNVRSGKMRRPEPPSLEEPASTAVAVVPKGGHAVAKIDGERRELVRDPAMVAHWQEQMETAEREKAVSKAYFT